MPGIGRGAMMSRRGAARYGPEVGASPGKPPKRPGPFGTHDQVLDAAMKTFAARARRRRLEAHPTGRGVLARAAREAAAWEAYWHGSFELTGEGLPFCQRCRAAKLDRIERELVVALLLGELGLVGWEMGNAQEALSVLSVSGTGSLAVYRSLNEGGRLAESGLVTVGSDEPVGLSTGLTLDPDLTDAVLYGGGASRRAWRVASEEELYGRMRSITRTVLHKNHMLAMADESLHEELYAGFRGLQRNPEEAFSKASRTLDRLRGRLEATLAENPGFRLNGLLGCDGLEDREDRLVLVLLLGKELGHTAPANELFRGIGLARALASEAREVDRRLRHLRPDAPLMARNLIQPCGGDHLLAGGDEKELARTEFELSARSLDLLEKAAGRSRRYELAGQSRKPRVAMSQLVLPAAVREALDMALAQVRSSRTMALEWGLAEAVSYGRGVTLLFWGPPGTGKTAAAEALAGELGREILVADYSEIENCYLGQTEKNIVRVFRQAREAGAVLLWDECDAMFFDRDAAQYSWEARGVNVLLQELERFDGVCVLATNRKVTLDAALERRIGIKVQFPRPDRESRRRIWEKLLPAKMPLAGDVDLGRLAEPDLSGGEIKNVVLNAARLALARGEAGPVTRADFLRAVQLETEGRWAGQPAGQMGFARAPGR